MPELPKTSQLCVNWLRNWIVCANAKCCMHIRLLRYLSHAGPNNAVSNCIADAESDAISNYTESDAVPNAVSNHAAPNNAAAEYRSNGSAAAYRSAFGAAYGRADDARVHLRANGSPGQKHRARRQISRR